MKVLPFVSALVIGITAVASHASDVTIPNTFTPGVPAVAGHVNANFTAIKAAVDDNDSRLDAIEPATLSVNCSGSPGALQTAVNSPRLGLLTINFDGNCGPVTINRSDITLIGSGSGTSSIGGASGNNFSLHLTNVKNITLQNTRLNRIDTSAPILMVSQSSMVLDTVEIDFSTEGTWVINGSSLTMRDCQINSSMGAYLGSSLVIEDNNNFNVPASTALSASNSSSIFFFGMNNMVMAGMFEDALIASENSSVGMMETSDVYINGNVSAENSSHVFLASATNLTGNISITSSSVSLGDWTGSPMTIWGNVSVMDSSHFEVSSGVFLNGNLDIQSSSVTLGNWGGPMVNVFGDIDLRMGADLRMDSVYLNGYLHASNSITIEAQDSQISGSLVMDGPFVNFQGNNVQLWGGGTIRDYTKISLNGWSLLQGNYDVFGGFGWLDTPVDTFSANFTTCGAISMQSVIGFPGHVCQDADSDGTMNYLDYCPTTFGTGAPAGCP